MSLTEKFKATLKSESYVYEAKYTEADGTESVDFKEGAKFSLEKLTPKVATDFVRWMLTDGFQKKWMWLEDETWINIDGPPYEKLTIDQIFEKFIEQYDPQKV